VCAVIVVLSVVALLVDCFPTAVRWKISSVIIDTTERVMFAWPAPHVGKEVFILKPTFADGDTTPAIMFEKSAILIQAAIFHACPSLVFWGRYFGIAVFQSSAALFDTVGNEQTSARFGKAISKYITSDFGKLSAITLAEPTVRPVGLLRQTPNYQQASIALAGQVYHSVWS
jgi:hypothetical protein